MRLQKRGDLELRYKNKALYSDEVTVFKLSIAKFKQW
jgi:hypothetical protein